MKTISVCWPIKPERWDISMVNTITENIFARNKFQTRFFFLLRPSNSLLSYRSSSLCPSIPTRVERRKIYGFSMAVERKSFSSSLPMPLSGLFVCFRTAGGIKIIFMGLSLFISCQEKCVKNLTFIFSSPDSTFSSSTRFARMLVDVHFQLSPF